MLCVNGITFNMGLAHSPSIISDGLVLYVDAANLRSYSGSGITMNGLAGAGVTLANGPSFNSSNLGYITFDGTNDFSPFEITGIGNTITIDLWAKIKDFSLKMPIGFFEYTVFAYNGAIGFNTNNSDIYGLTSTQVNNLNISSQWAHYIFEMRTDVSYTNNKMYINGNFQSLSAVLGTENGSKRSFNDGKGRLSGYYYSPSSYATPMDIGLFKIYNRALSATEILQNYNATRKRFGL